MLVNLYKTKTPLAVFSFPIAIAILGLPILFIDYEAQPTFFNWQFVLEVIVMKIQLLHYFATVFIIYLAGIALNRLVNVFGFFSKNTYLPGLIFAISLIGFGEFKFSMDLIAYMVIIWGLDFLFRINRQDPAQSNVFMAALFFGLATLFDPLLAPINLLPWLSLMVFRSFVWREWLFAILGAILPWIFFIAIFFALSGKVPQAPILTQAEQHESLYSQEMLVLLGFVLFLSLYAIWRYLIILNNQLLIIKKRSRLLFHLSWMSLISIALAWLIMDDLLMVINIPLSIIIGVQILNNRESFVGNIVLYSWLAISAWVIFT